MNDENFHIKTDNYLHYKDYIGSVEFSEADAVFHKKLGWKIELLIGHMYTYWLSTWRTKCHNLQINDALIAASSIKLNAELITYNISDFNYIPNIKLYQFTE